LSLKKGKDKIWSWAPKGSPIPGKIGRQTVGRNINSTQLKSYARNNNCKNNLLKKEGKKKKKKNNSKEKHSTDKD
jgi:hypothetical protein